MGRCSISETIAYNLGEGRATVKIDDPACLKWGGSYKVFLQGVRCCFPRFVAYDAERPELFRTSLIEPPDAATPSIGLDMPASYKLIGGGIVNSAAFVEALSNNPATEATLELRTELQGSRLRVLTAPLGCHCQALTRVWFR